MNFYTINYSGREFNELLRKIETGEIVLSPEVKDNIIKEVLSQVEEGVQGEQGPVGPMGPVGPEGKQGIQGEKGEKGDKGDKGDQGEVGPKGDQGIQGIQGEPGEKGEKGEPGEQGPAGQDGAPGEKGEKGDKGDPGEKGQDGVNGVDGKDGANGVDGKDGIDGVGVVGVEIQEGHLMVQLSNNEVVDAGELPVGEGGVGGGADQEEVDALKAELSVTKQRLLDLTYGVEYEWLYVFDHETVKADLPITPETCPEFFNEFAEICAAGDDAIEEWITKMYEEDIFRMYILKAASDHRYCNRYEMLPLEGHTVQLPNENIANWEPVRVTTSWNWNGNDDGGFSLDVGTSSAMTFAFLKVKK